MLPLLLPLSICNLLLKVCLQVKFAPSELSVACFAPLPLTQRGGHPHFLRHDEK